MAALRNSSRFLNLPKISAKHLSSKPQGKLPKKFPIAGVKKTILVSSAKGGVGKSLVSVNLALALKHLNHEKQIGILDADVYGPSLPLMMGLLNEEPPQLNKQNMMLPLVNYGVKCMSMGFLVNKEDAIIWRGLMVMQAMQKLLRSVYWGELDILIIDMPPGTGDTQLSTVQNIAIDGVIIVTTPSKVALADVIRGVKMYRSLETPILGFVQNMTHYNCANCQHTEYLFGADLANSLIDNQHIEHLADIPLDPVLSRCSDEGQPIIVKHPDSATSKSFYNLASVVLDKLK